MAQNVTKRNLPTVASSHFTRSSIETRSERRASRSPKGPRRYNRSAARQFEGTGTPGAGLLFLRAATPKRAAEKCGPGAGEWAMSRWEELKMLLLALAISVALATAGALLAISMAHL